MIGYSQFSIEKELYSEYLKVNMSGIASPSDVKKAYRDISNVANSNGINKVLVDCAKLELSYDSFEVLKVMKSIKQHPIGLKLARVTSHSGHKNILIQQIAEKKALNFQSFNCVEQALCWLIYE